MWWRPFFEAYCGTLFYRNLLSDILLFISLVVGAF